MSNMSYCRFENTAKDLRDCKEHILDTEDLGIDEARARHDLIALCQDILEEVGCEVNQDGFTCDCEVCKSCEADHEEKEKEKRDEAKKGIYDQGGMMYEKESEAKNEKDKS